MYQIRINYVKMKNLIKNFFSIEYFYELRPLLIIESVTAVLGYLMTMNIITIDYFNIHALFIAFFLWVTCSLMDSKKYFNFYSFLATIIFCYGFFWFVFECLFIKF